MDLLDFTTVDSLASQYGDAFYILKHAEFADNVRELLAELRRGYSNAALGYSVKTNYIPALVQEADRLGCYTEVVSTMEYDLALKAGIAGDRIIFNGPLKTQSDLERAFANRSLVNLDSWSEVELLESLPPLANGTRPVGVRCNFEIEPGFQSRFGFSVENGSLAEAIRRLKAIPSLQICGLHCHFTTRGRTAAAYALRVETLAKIAREMLPGTTLDYVDIGGGIFGKLDENIRSQFPMEVPSYAEYAEQATKAMRAHFSPEQTRLIMEPGVGITANVLDFYARIADVKKIGDRKIALCTGSVHNVKPSLNKAQLTTHTIARNPGSGPSQAYELVGYTCLEYDIIGEHRSPRLSPGDYVRFDNVGAYTVVFTPPFIKAAPAILAYVDGTVTCARRAQTHEDIFLPYTF
jgi:diaminopimelate decarboxylase